MPTEDPSQLDKHQVQGVSIRHCLRVNRFMLIARLAQYWLIDFYSRVLDQRMGIIGKIKTWIMMGQTGKTNDALTEHKEQDRHAAGYTEQPKN